MRLVVIAIVLITGLAGCRSSPQDTAVSADQVTNPLDGQDESTDRLDTPEGVAVVDLVVEPQEVDRGGQVSLRLINRGDVTVVTGLGFDVERWDGNTWVAVPWPDGAGFPGRGISLSPGDSTDLQHWPDPYLHEEPMAPGWYRVVKSAKFEDPDRVQPDKGLVVRTRFRVRL